MDKRERAQMMSLEVKVQEMDGMLAQALGVVSDLLGTVKEMRAAEESHRYQTQAALRTAASERSSLASAIERVRKGFETPDARELRSKIENLRTAVAGNTASIAEVREELAAVDNAQMQAARDLTEDDGEQRERLEALEDRMEKVEAIPAVGPFLIPYDGSSAERQWKQLGPSDLPDTHFPYGLTGGQWGGQPVWVVNEAPSVTDLNGTRTFIDGPVTTTWVDPLGNIVDGIASN